MGLGRPRRVFIAQCAIIEAHQSPRLRAAPALPGEIMKSRRENALHRRAIRMNSASERRQSLIIIWRAVISR
jgi:hypothetical protein